MNLRKLSQQSYFKTKQNTCIKGDIIEEEESQVNTSKKSLKYLEQKHKKNVSQHSTSPQSNQSQLFQKFKTFISSTSPNQKYTTKPKNSINTVSQFTTDTKAKQSTAEQEEVIQRLLNWEKKRQQELEKQQKQHEIKEKQNLREKPALTKETKKICESGLKHHFQLSNFIKFRHQQIQCQNDNKYLTKFERLKKGTKIIIEHEVENDENLDDENNKSTQYQFVAPEQVENQGIVNKEYRSKSDICNMPIHLRYEYEIQFKEAKLAQLRNQKQQQFEEQLQLQQKYNSTAEQFEHFLSEQENFLKRKQQFQTEQFKKQLDQIQELDALNTYSPVINFPPVTKKEEKYSSKEEKFNQKLNTLEEQKSKQKGFYFFRSTLPDVRKSIKKKYDEILHKSDIANHNQFETERL